MLEQIRIRSLGVIEQAEIEIGPGFTALTGETGAGKTMVLTALGLVLGNRGEASLVRTGAERLAVSATFRATPQTQLLVDEQGGEVEDGCVVLARMMTPDGRSRALVGGASAPAAILNEIGEELISIHAQLSTSRLLKPARQRELLDRYGGLGDLLSTYRDAYKKYGDAVKVLDDYLADQRNAAAIAAELTTLVEMVDEVRPQLDEYQKLEEIISRLSHHDEIARAIDSARNVASEESGLVEIAGSLRHLFDGVRGKDPLLDQIGEKALEISILASELATEISRYQDSLDVDPTALDTAHSRLSKLQSLLRRFSEEQSNEGLKSLIARFESAQERLASLNLGQERLDQLKSEVDSARSQMAKAARSLSLARQEAAKKLATEVTDEVRALAMPHAEISIEISHRDDPQGLTFGERNVAFDSNGIDHVEFKLAATATTPSVPIAKGASGGELSRVMLALEVVLAAADPVPTYVFDEVDAGIGGQAALEVGRRLARLAESSQVIVVTHLAQVAAFADHHIVVTKGESGSVTTSQVSLVEGPAREEELARMMAGLAGSATAQASAAELLALGARGR